jgi:NitT/TauT family transport system substrate-binding protein
MTAKLCVFISSVQKELEDECLIGHYTGFLSFRLPVVRKRSSMKRKMDILRRRALSVAIAVIAAVLLSSALPVKEVCAEPVRVGFPRDISAAPIILADSQGFFKKRGVDVMLKEYEAGVTAVNDLLADKLDLATASEFVFVLQSFRHSDLRMPATLCSLSVIDLVVRKDRAIAKPGDLKGKRVSVPRGTASEFFLFNYLVFNGIPADTVRIVYIPPSEIVKALVSGAVDAAICWPPYTTDMEKQLGARVARWPAQSGQDYYFALFAKEKFLKMQPKMMERFLAALSDAEGFIGEYPDQAQTILRNRLKFDVESFPATWSRARFRLQLTQDLLVLMEQEAKWAVRNKLAEAKEVPNFLGLFHFDAMDKVKPEAVSIVH